MRRVALPFLVSRDAALDRKRNNMKVIRSARSRTRSHVRSYIRSQGLVNDGDPPEYAAVTLGIVAKMSDRLSDDNHRPRNAPNMIFTLHPVLDALVEVGWLASLSFQHLKLESPWRRAPLPGEREAIHVLVEELTADDRERHLAPHRW